MQMPGTPLHALIRRGGTFACTAPETTKDAWNSRGYLGPRRQDRFELTRIPKEVAAYLADRLDELGENVDRKEAIRVAKTIPLPPKAEGWTRRSDPLYPGTSPNAKKRSASDVPGEMPAKKPRTQQPSSRSPGESSKQAQLRADIAQQLAIWQRQMATLVHTLATQAHDAETKAREGGEESTAAAAAKAEDSARVLKAENQARTAELEARLHLSELEKSVTAEETLAAQAEASLQAAEERLHQAQRQLGRRRHPRSGSESEGEPEAKRKTQD